MLKVRKIQKEGAFIVNIFETGKGFFGDYKKGKLKILSNDFWSKASKFRKSLGENAYILDSYLCSIFSTIEKLYVDDVINRADNLVGEIEGICRSICESRSYGKESHWFFETAKNYIETHPLKYKDNTTRAYIYMICLFDDFADTYFEKTFNGKENKYRNIYASNAVAENLNTIRNYLSDGEIKVLNEAIKKRFVAPALSNLFMRTLSSQLCYYLLVEDKETSKRLFQIILEENIIN